MTREERTAVVLKLLGALAEQSKWHGSTHLQKTTYFLQKLTNVELDYDFILYKHGPFSFELRDEITEMLTYDLMKVVPNPPPYGPNLISSDAGIQLQEQESQAVRRHAIAVEFVAKHLGAKGAVELERLGTALYVTLEDERKPADERAQRIHQSKPHVSPEQALEDLDEVDCMRQLTPSPT